MEELMRADEAVRAGILRTVAEYSKALESSDLNAVMSLKVQDPDLRFIGSGLDEWRDGVEQVKSQVKRDFTQARRLKVVFSEVHVCHEGGVAWIAAPTTVRVDIGHKEHEYFGRFTAVLLKRGDRWLFAQIHFSIPAAGKPEGKSYPTYYD
jgi:ketosteroid isomerase-like protein